MEKKQEIDQPRTVYLTEEISSRSIGLVLEEMQELMEINGKTIKLMIMSSGGCMYSALGLYDFIRSSKVNVSTYAAGLCMSAATIIWLAGHKRFSYKNTTFMFHSVGSGGLSEIVKLHEGKTDIQETARLFEVMCSIYSKNCHKKYTTDYWKQKLQYQDVFLTSKELLDLKIDFKVVK